MPPPNEHVVGGVDTFQEPTVVQIFKCATAYLRSTGIGKGDRFIFYDHDTLCAMLRERPVALLRSAYGPVCHAVAGNLPDVGTQSSLPIVRRNVDEQFNCNQRSRFMEGFGFKAAIPPGERTRRKKLLKSCVVGNAVLRRDNECVHILAHRLGTRPAQHALSTRIPVAYFSGRCYFNYGVARAVQ